MSVVDYYTKTMKRRGRQIDKVYDYWQKASDAYVRGGVNLNSGPATRWLKKLRDYLDKEFPDDRRKDNRASP